MEFPLQYRMKEKGLTSRNILLVVELEISKVELRIQVVLLILLQTLKKALNSNILFLFNSYYFFHIAVMVLYFVHS